MIGILFALLLGIVLAAIVHNNDRKDQGLSMLGIIMGGYVLRLILQLFIRDIEFFSHAAGGDCTGYEATAVEIARLWRVLGVTFMTEEQIPGIGATVLPQNMFAGIVFLNGGEASRLGCTALIAFAAGITCFNVYHVALDLGADPVTARRTITLFYFGPTYLHYTADMFKDGLVTCFALSALISGVRLMQRISVLHIVIGLLSLWALWFVRYYLIFVTTAPLLVGLVGLRSKSIVRPLFASLVLVGAGLLLLEFTDVAQQVSEKASITYEVGTADNVLASNAMGGSGVTFDDDGKPFGQLWLKLFYTIFAPFPWASGSVGFQVGKIDVFIIAFFLLRSVAVARKQELSLVVLMIMTFAVPCTVMYATSMANVGLIARQRLVVVVTFAFLASLYRPAVEKAKVRAGGLRRGLSFATGVTKSLM